MAWSQEQMRNAVIIMQVGRRMGMSTRDIQTGIITSLVESNLINVNYGDRDSLGLFQQRPSQGWGSPNQVRDPEYAAGKFFSALRNLGDKRNRMSMGAAAQAVQRSAYPGRYDQRVGEMRDNFPGLLKAAGENPTTSATAYNFETNGDEVQQSSLSADAVLGTLEEDGEPTSAGATAVGEASTSAVGEVGQGDTQQTMVGEWGINSPQAYDPEDEYGDYMMAGLKGDAGALIKSLQSGDTYMEGYAKGVDGWRSQVIEAAKTALGVMYQWGGNSLAGGVDCSGLVQQAFAAAGISLPRISAQQAQAGQRVGLNALQPGDLVAWDNSSRNNGADHIAIYLGNGQIIEAPRTGLAVRIRSLSGDEGAWGVRMKR